MKKTLGLIAAAMLLVGGVAFAEEAMLIDFTQLDADYELTDSDGNVVSKQNKRTTMDYAVSAGSTFTKQQKDLMRTSLSLPEWEVTLNSSAKTVQSLADSQVVAAPVKESADVPFAGKNVMGVRIVFPTWNSNANARIVPPFDIPAYEPLSTVSDDGERKPLSEDEDASSFNVAQNPSFEKTLFEGGFGVVKNVGTIKSIKVTTMGMQFPHGLYVHLTDNDNVERRYFMGYLGFDGWKELRWNNPQYISEIRNREIRVYPIYPRGTPFIKFAGFEITRDASHIGGDFIGYFKDVQIIYDKAILTSDRDIADEDLWGIIGKKESDRQAAEMSKFGNKQVNRYLEKSKLATEENFTSSLYEDSDSNAQSNAGQAADAK
ncbi:MAG: flagellar filament outer layer protein FlaA [Treponema sp.]|nr:flagellar filament outer layer protein FlaA [Treponema sp.]MBR5033471.1 flagellar filament outer layer protein FlaA [Treponema sp.]